MPLRIPHEPMTSGSPPEPSALKYAMPARPNLLTLSNHGKLHPLTQPANS